ncbi:4-hydroxy-tetrahydrodipicolinate reductase [Phenylobacterium sp.]|uniref:4-hydroxy-tetrahydrodipicolinate reductase n=1 Tax=Phenylobacterium sp. TaxID=1871053 RepID=UPI0025E9D74B|nr:4-hydroxy-tetrahydrodipicolinate reductase [Phenylobacterium sp.]MCA3720676.1 4-hydroxy-tetrahydrodipicolinate reductase [Phenylobacterium sp.]
MTPPIRIAISGALGRMGLAVAEAVEASPDLILAGRFDRPDAVDPILTDWASALEGADVVVDFSTPAASVALAGEAATLGRPALVIGSTGFSPGEIDALAEAALRIPIVRAGNFSLGVNMLMGLVELAAAALSPAEFDIEVFEAHHRRKVDAPSGTALMLGEAAARGRGVDLDRASIRARDGITGARPEGAIGFSVVRGGGVIGEHSVLFAGEDEILTLSHSARDRGLFARGALAAARWVVSREPGAYDMQDVLGFRR